MEEYQALVALLADVEKDVIKFFEKGNAAAGTRIRKAMQEVKAQAQTVRLKVQEIKGAE